MRKRGLDSSTCEIIDLEPEEEAVPSAQRKVIALWTEEDVAACKRRRSEVRMLIQAYVDVHKQLEEEERLQISLIQIARQIRSVTPLPATNKQPVKIVLRASEVTRPLRQQAIEIAPSQTSTLPAEKREL